MREALPDLIITDCSMPRMSGLELCAALRCDLRTSQIPIILHTAIEPDCEGERLYDRIFVKPAELRLLAASIRELLRNSVAHANEAGSQQTLLMEELEPAFT